MSNRWRHSLCDPCFKELRPDTIPFRVADKYRCTESCCKCGERHRSGIYYSDEPDRFQCKGQHE